MHEHFAIRQATPADAAALAKLRWDLRALQSPLLEEESPFRERCTSWMRARLAAASSWQSWIAERTTADAVEGCIWVQLIEKIPNCNGDAEKFAYISTLYVRPESRGALGTRLLRASLDALDDRGIEHVLLWPTTRSRGLYQRAGFAVPEELMLRSANAVLCSAGRPRPASRTRHVPS